MKRSLSPVVRAGLVSVWLVANGSVALILKAAPDRTSNDLAQGPALIVPASDWPAYRRDGGLTGFSPLRGGLAHAPSRRWTVELGGPRVPAEGVRFEDLNGDGHDELLRVLADRLVCQNIRGGRLWETPPLSHPNVDVIHDFAGDGTRGLLVRASTGTEHRTYLISGINGKTTLLYTTRNVFGRYERFGKILAGVRGDQLCAWWSGDPVATFGGDGMRGFGYLWSFEKGLETPTLRFHADEVGTIYAPLHLFADMDGDGDEDMVMVSHEQLWVYDLRSGKKIMQSIWGPQIRTYWAATAAMPLVPGELPSLLMINPMLPGVQVVTQDGTKAVSRWKRVVGDDENQYQKKVKIERAAPDPFVDLDGDGDIEILAAVTNEHDDGETYLTMFRASDGHRVFDQPGLSVIAVDDLDGDGRLEVFLREGDGALRISNWIAGRFVDRWRGFGVEPLTIPEPSEGHLARAVGARVTRRNMPLWRLKDGSEFVLMRRGADVVGCRLVPAGTLEFGGTIETHEVLGNSSRPPKPYAWNGRELTIRADGKSSTTYTLPHQQQYRAPPPLVGRHGGARRIFVREASGAYVSYAPDGADRRVVAPQTPPVNGASLTDLDGSDTNELLVLSGEDRARANVVTVDAAGQRRLQISPPEGCTEATLGPSGRLGQDGGRWFVVRYRVAFQNTRVVAYDGRDGAQLWERDFLGPERVPSTTFVLHLPTAVHDVDGDGADDLIASSENWYEVISVRDNRTVTPNTVITAAVPGHWGAYAVPVVADLTGRGSPLVFHNGAYALTLVTETDGTPRWHYGLTRDTTHAAMAGFADLDASGTLEIVTTQKDGLLRGFDAQPTAKKCPTCPPAESRGDANRSGGVRWTFRLPPPVSDFASLDLDGNGSVELVCGAGDGKLYALQETNGHVEMLWSLDLGSEVGAPVIADLDADGLPEVLVSSADGRLHALGAAAVSK